MNRLPYGVTGGEQEQEHDQDQESPPTESSEGLSSALM
jgi:hypothetical protein